jgi:hypothetical protein
LHIISEDLKYENNSESQNIGVMSLFNKILFHVLLTGSSWARKNGKVHVRVSLISNGGSFIGSSTLVVIVRKMWK